MNESIPVVILSCKVAGTFHQQEGWAVARNLIQEGQVLHLEREPDNVYDPNAIAIWYDWDGPHKAKLGYIPYKKVSSRFGVTLQSESTSKIVAEYMARSDGQVTCKVGEFTPSELVGYRPILGIEVTWTWLPNKA